MEDADEERQHVYTVLNNERRRIAFECLVNGGPTLGVPELAEQVAARETGESPPTRSARRSVYTALTHHHLPKLEEVGIVEFDSEQREVALEPHARTLSVEVVPDHELSWAEYYLALGTLGLVTVALAVLGWPVVSQVPPQVYAVAFFLLFIGSAVAQLRPPNRELLGRT